MKKTAVAGLAALSLFEISAATPAAAQGANSHLGPYIGGHAGAFTSDANFSSAPYTVVGPTGTFPIPGRNHSFDVDGLIGGGVTAA